MRGQNTTDCSLFPDLFDRPLVCRFDLPNGSSDDGEPIYEDDPLVVDVTPGLRAGDAWAPDAIEHLEDNRVVLDFNIDMTPNRVGPVSLGARQRGMVRVTDLNLTGIPNIVQTVWDEIIMEFRLSRVDLDVQENPGAVPLTIASGMTALEGLDVAYESVNDPAPLGNPTDPWLYVVGAQGIRYYRLVMDESGFIRSTEQVSSILLTNITGVTAISAGSGGENTRLLYMNGTTGSCLTYWNPSGNDYGMLGGAILIPVSDAVAYGGVAHSRGMSVARGYAIERHHLRHLQGGSSALLLEDGVVRNDRAAPSVPQAGGPTRYDALWSAFFRGGCAYRPILLQFGAQSENRLCRIGWD